MKKFLEKILYATLIIAALWFTTSWVEVLCKNTNENPEYSNTNMIVQLTEIAKEMNK